MESIVVAELLAKIVDEISANMTKENRFVTISPHKHLPSFVSLEIATSISRNLVASAFENAVSNLKVCYSAEDELEHEIEENSIALRKSIPVPPPQPPVCALYFKDVQLQQLQAPMAETVAAASSRVSIPSSATHVCCVCLDDDVEMKNMFRCNQGHWMCHDCTQRLCEVSINEGNVPRCCNCKTDALILSETVVRQVVSEADFARFMRLKTLRTNELSRECPQCDALQFGTEGEMDMCCSECGTKFCFLHSLAHKGKSCRGFREPVRETVAAWFWKKTKAQKCPHCKRHVQRNGGCPHMTCRCGGQFCWYCGTDWAKCGSRHRQILNFRPSACWGPRYIAARTLCVLGAAPALGLAICAAPFVAGIVAVRCAQRAHQRRRRDRAAMRAPTPVTMRAHEMEDEWRTFDEEIGVFRDRTSIDFLPRFVALPPSPPPLRSVPPPPPPPPPVRISTPVPPMSKQVEESMMRAAQSLDFNPETVDFEAPIEGYSGTRASFDDVILNL